MTTKADKREGPYEEFYEDGKLHYRWNYKDDRLDGLSEGFYPDGSLSCRCSYQGRQAGGTV